MVVVREGSWRGLEPRRGLVGVRDLGYDELWRTSLFLSSQPSWCGEIGVSEGDLWVVGVKKGSLVMLGEVSSGQ